LPYFAYVAHFARLPPPLFSQAKQLYYRTLAVFMTSGVLKTNFSLAKTQKIL